jgi:hypothetical protein
VPLQLTRPTTDDPAPTRNTVDRPRAAADLRTVQKTWPASADRGRLTLMPRGYLTLADYPTAMVRLACDRCDRRGQYRKDRLIAEHGADVVLPDLRHKFAAGCPTPAIAQRRAASTTSILPREAESGPKTRPHVRRPWGQFDCRGVLGASWDLIPRPSKSRRTRGMCNGRVR